MIVELFNSRESLTLIDKCKCGIGPPTFVKQIPWYCGDLNLTIQNQETWNLNFCPDFFFFFQYNSYLSGFQMVGLPDFRSHLKSIHSFCKPTSILPFKIWRRLEYKSPLYCRLATSSQSKINSFLLPGRMIQLQPNWYSLSSQHQRLSNMPMDFSTATSNFMAVTR